MNKPTILDGKYVASEIENQLKPRVEAIISKSNQTPKLATIIVGSDPASQTYVNMKEMPAVVLEWTL